MANAYGFDFLKSEHTLTSAANGGYIEEPTFHEQEIAAAPAEPVAPAADVANKSDLEKQFDVIHFLQAHRSSGCILPSIIHKSIGIDLSDGGRDEAVTRMLETNPKIRIEEIPDPENPSLSVKTFGYQAKFNNIRDKTGLLAQINRCKNGVASKDLSDAYEGVEVDLAALVCAGDVLAVTNSEDKDRILFPRGEQFIVELDGNIAAPNTTKAAMLGMDPKLLSGGSPSSMAHYYTSHPVLSSDNDHCIVELDMDPRKQLRRGEAVFVGGQWYRISSAVKEGVSLSEQPVRAQAPSTVVLRRDMSKKNDADGYIRPLDERRLPLDGPLPHNVLTNLRAAAIARERLFKIASGSRVTGGVSAQLLSSNASSTNPEALAKAFASTTAAALAGTHHGGGAGRRRPGGGAGGAASSSVVGRGRVNGPNKSDRLPTAMPPGHVPSNDDDTFPAGGPRASAASTAEAIEAARRAASDPALAYSHARRHGCSKDVRELYFSTRADVPESEQDLHTLMIEHKLVDPNEPMRRPRMKKKNANIDNDGKPRKRRYYERKGARMTNTHLAGTEIGMILARAAEKQAQGKQVGDGGM